MHTIIDDKYISTKLEEIETFDADSFDPMISGRVIPQSEPQVQFLSTCADIAIYGGAAGGGKSFALQLECLRHIGVNGFSFIVFRRSFPEITNPNGLWDESYKIFPLVDGKPKVSFLEWHFPGGAKGKFGHLQFDETVYEHQGAQYCLMAFDELTHFSEFQFFYMMSRNRSVCGVKPYIRATTNPDANSWVKKIVAPWIDKGFPNPAVGGELRWFIRRNNETVWVDDNKRLSTGEIPKSITFIPASVFDNKVLMKRNPEYISNLMSLPPVEKARLLFGDWDVISARFFDMWQSSNINRDGVTIPWHVVPTRRPPKDHEYTVGIDYGYAKPFAAYLIGIDSQGYATIYREIYATKLNASEQATQINKMLTSCGIPLDIPKFAGHDAFAQQRGAENRQQPIVEIWNGDEEDEPERRLINVVQAGRDPLTRATIIREYLNDWGVTEQYKVGRPGLQIMECCDNLIRTLPNLTNDKNRPEQIDSTMEDHGYDAIGHVLTSRPPRPNISTIPIEEELFSKRILRIEEQKQESETYEW